MLRYVGGAIVAFLTFNLNKPSLRNPVQIKFKPLIITTLFDSNTSLYPYWTNKDPLIRFLMMDIL